MFFYEDQFISETLSDTQFFFKLTIFLVLTNVNSILSVTHETILSRFYFGDDQGRSFIVKKWAMAPPINLKSIRLIFIF
jgi:hypothetical protein